MRGTSACFRPSVLFLGVIGMLLFGRETVAAFGYHHASSKPPTSARARIPSFAAALVISSTILLDATGAAAADIGHGATLFADACAACHIGGGNVISEKRTLQKDALEKYVGLQPENVEQFFKTNGRHKMLVFYNLPGGKLTDENVQDVAAYIVDQAMGNKW